MKGYKDCGGRRELSEECLHCEKCSAPPGDCDCAEYNAMLAEHDTGAAAAAVKHDGGKPPLHLVPRELLEGAARAYAFGAKKYAAWNYREGDGLAITRLADSALRHLVAWAHAEEADPESGLCHLDHAAAALGMLMDTARRVRDGALPQKTDDRWKGTKR